MLVLHLSDLHTEAGRGLAYGVADTASMLEAAVTHVKTLRQKPDCAVVTGDLASSGREEAYAIVRDALETLDMPVYVVPGNHDRRAALLEYLGPWCPADPSVAPYLCYTVEGGPLRLVMLDTSRPGSHSGHLDSPELAWLQATLETAPHTPTLLFLHHPPFLSGMGAMDEPFENAEALAEVVRRFPLVRLCSGHLHRALTTVWADRVCVSAPAVSMQMELDLCPTGGDAFVMEAPGYMLHHWLEGRLVSHFCQIPGAHSYSGPHPFAGVINPV